MKQSLFGVYEPNFSCFILALVSCYSTTFTKIVFWSFSVFIWNSLENLQFLFHYVNWHYRSSLCRQELKNELFQFLIKEALMHLLLWIYSAHREDKNTAKPLCNFLIKTQNCDVFYTFCSNKNMMMFGFHVYQFFLCFSTNKFVTLRSWWKRKMLQARQKNVPYSMKATTEQNQTAAIQ